MYILKLWNGQWGNLARFVAYDPQIGKYTEYSPVNTLDMIWVDYDLTLSPEYETWQDCNDEPIEELDDVAV